MSAIYSPQSLSVSCQAFTMPAIGATVALTVDTTAPFAIGQYVWCPVAGWLLVTAIGAGTITVENPPGFSSNAASGTAVPAATVSISGDATISDRFDVRRYGATSSDVGAGVSAALTATRTAVGGEVYVPAIVSGQWEWQSHVVLDFSSLPSSGAYARFSLRGAPGAIIKPANLSGSQMLEWDNVFSGMISISDLSFRGVGDGVTADANFFMIKAGANQIVAERLQFFDCLVQGGFGFGMLQFGAEQVAVRNCSWLSCGCNAANGACLVVGGSDSVHIQQCHFRDIPGTAIAGWAWIQISDCQSVDVENCFFDEDQAYGIYFTGTTTNTVARIHGGNCAVASPTASPLSTATATFKTAPGAGLFYKLSIEDFYAQFVLGKRVFADITNSDLSLKRVRAMGNGNGSTPGAGDFGIVWRSPGVGRLEIDEYMGLSRRPWLDFSLGAPALATIRGANDAVPRVLPCSLAGVHTWCEPDLGPTFSAPASVTGAGATYAEVTAGHTLQLLVNGGTFTVTFSGAENTQTAFINAINAISPYFTASNASGQIKITANYSPPNTPANMSYGQVLATSSADVLASLGLTSGEAFSGAVVSAVVDQSGKVDATHNLAAGAGGGPAYTFADADFGGQPSWTFSANESLVATWGTALSQPFTVCVAAKQVSAATAFLLDGKAAGEAHVNGVSTENALHVDAGTDVSVAATTGAAHIYMITFDGATTTVGVDSLTVSTVSAGTGGMSGITLGNSQAGSQAAWKVAGLAIFTGSLSKQAAQQYLDYASARWGIVQV